MPDCGVVRGTSLRPECFTHLMGAAGKGGAAGRSGLPEPAESGAVTGTKRRGWTRRVLVRYVLLQMPGAVLVAAVLVLLRRWLDLPWWTFWGTLLLWAAKDVVMFPLTWRAYDWDASKSGSSMVGLPGVAKERLAPSGYVVVRGELWRAETTGDCPPIEERTSVRVHGVRGLVLLVRPE